MKTTNQVIWLNNPFDISDHESHESQPGQTIQSWINANGGTTILNVRPTVCYYQGKQIMRDEYKNIIIENPVCFITLPEGGGGGSNPLQLMAMVAVSVLSVYTGGLAAGLFATGSFGSVAAGAAAVMAVNMAGAAIISAVVGQPEGANNTPSQASPTYSLQAQGNAARIGGAIPVIYGTNRIYPDFAAQPYAMFENNDQYLHQLFSIGQGDVDVSEIKFEDTDSSTFLADYEIVKPHQKLKMFHSAVDQVEAAGGQMLTTTGTLGPYVIGGPSDEYIKIAFDVVFPGGLIKFDDSGNESSASVGITIFAQAINAEGVATKNKIELFTGEITKSTRTAQRLTFSKDVAKGRYQVTIQRTTEKGDSKTTDSMQIGSVKGFKQHDNVYGNITLLAMRVRANDNLSNAASRKVNCIAQGKVREWSSKTGWTKPKYSSNPAWIFADICRSSYGGNYEDKRIDLLGLEQLASKFNKRKDSFNGIFDSATTLTDALKKVSQTVRSTPIRQGNLIRMIRDQYQAIPATVFSHANIKEFSINFSMPGEESSDAVRAIFWDKTTGYKQGEVLCKLPGSAAVKPKELSFFGITNREQAWREGIYHISSSTYRRAFVNFKTEMEGYIPSYGDIVLINHYLLNPEEMISGLIIFSKDDELTLSISVDGDVGANWLMSLRNNKGEPSNPIKVVKINDNTVKALDPIPFKIDFNPNDERTHFIAGKGTDWAARIKVIGIEPEYDDQVKISGVIEDDRVHEEFDTAQMPTKNFFETISKYSPIIVGLSATQGGTKENPMIYVHWAAVEKSKEYYVEVSYDNERTWEPIGQPVSPFIQFKVPRGEVVVRVSANGVIRGKWSKITVNAGNEFSVPTKLVLKLDSAFNGKEFKTSWNAEPSAIFYRIQMVYKGALLREFYQEASKTDFAYTSLMGNTDGAGRELTIKVCAQNGNEVQGPWAELSATNPAPKKIAVSEVHTEGFMDAVMLKISYKVPDDFDRYVIHGSINKGFPVTTGNIISFDESANPSFNVPTKAGFYIRIAASDVWGIDNLNYSDEIKVTNIRDVINEMKGEITEEFLDEALKEDIKAVKDKAGTNASAITKLKIVDEKAAKDIKNIQSVNESQSTSLTEVNKSVDGIEAMKAVVIDNNGTVGGYKLVSKMNDSGTPVSQMSFAVDKFFIVDPKNKKNLPFIVDVKTNSVVIGDTLIRDGSIVADKINVTQLSAITADIGNVSAGTFSTGGKTPSASGKTYAEISNKGTYPIWIGKGEKNEGNATFSISDNGYLYAKGQIECESGRFLLGLTADDGYPSLDSKGTLRNWNFVVERDGTLKAKDARMRDVHLEGSLDAQNISVNALNSTISGANIVGKTIIADMFIGPIGDFKEAHVVANNYYYGPSGKTKKGLWVASNPSGSVANIKKTPASNSTPDRPVFLKPYLKSPTSAKLSGTHEGGALGTYTATLNGAYSAIVKDTNIVKGRLKTTSVSCNVYAKLDKVINSAAAKGQPGIAGKKSILKVYSGTSLLGSYTIEGVIGTIRFGAFTLKSSRIVTGQTKKGPVYGPIELKGTISVPFASESSSSRIKIVLVANSHNNILRIDHTYKP